MVFQSERRAFENEVLSGIYGPLKKREAIM
jgi:hypothetical protein